jgi:hypothetical protein
MVEKGETNYDNIIELIRVALANGASHDEATANVALAQALLTFEVTDKLLALLVREKVLPQEEVDKLEADAQKAHRTGMLAMAEKNPDIAKKIKN